MRWRARRSQADRPRRAARIAAVLAVVVALASAGTAASEHVVQPGETLLGIALRHGVSAAVVAEHNGIPDPDRVVAGSRLQIPAGGEETSGGADAEHHVVERGETLLGIARRYGNTVAELVAWNGLASPHTVLAGSRLSVSGPAAPNLADAGGGTHTVQAGETLSGIALRHGVSIDALAGANGISDPDWVRAGTVLTMPGGWRCPVAGARFVNDYGIRKPGGRFHDGVDLFAPAGTPVRAPVAGQVEHVRGERAGLQFVLRGADGHSYIGTHLDRLDAAGSVAAGDVLGTVGTTGNAVGTNPHLHFEIHLHGDRLVSPYPTLRAACGS